MTLEEQIISILNNAIGGGNLPLKVSFDGTEYVLIYNPLNARLEKIISSKVLTQSQLDAALENYLALTGGTMTGALVVSNVTIGNDLTVEQDVFIENELTVNQDAYFQGSIDAVSFIGDGSQLTNLPQPDLSVYLPLTGGNLTGDLTSDSQIFTDDNGAIASRSSTNETSQLKATIGVTNFNGVDIFSTLNHSYLQFQKSTHSINIKPVNAITETTILYTPNKNGMLATTDDIPDIDESTAGNIGIGFTDFETEDTGEELQVEGLIRSNATVGEIEIADDEVVINKSYLESLLNPVTTFIGDVGAPSFENGWVNQGIYNSAGYYVIGDVVYLRGLISSGDTNLAIFTMPSSLAPINSPEFHFVSTNDKVGRIQINTNGSIVSKPINDSTWICLNGVSYRINN